MIPITARKIRTANILLIESSELAMRSSAEVVDTRGGGSDPVLTLVPPFVGL